MRLDRLRDLAHTPGPFATVYLDVSHDIPHAGHAVQLGWHELRSTLESEGADPATLAALDAEVSVLAEGEDPPVGKHGQVLVAAGGAVVLSRELGAPPERPSASWSPLPDLHRLVMTLPEPVSTVIAVVDANGADIYVGDHTGDRVREVRGPDRPLHQVRGTGLSHRHVMMKVREFQKQNTAEVAAAVDVEVARCGAGLLVLAGEVQSRSRLRGALGERAAAVAVEVDSGGRAEGTDDEQLAADIRRLRDERVTEQRRAAWERLERAGGHTDALGVEGLPVVLAAFRAALVDTLLLDADVRREPVWIGPDPTHVADREATLRELGVEPVGPVPADDALVRAIAGTGAEVYVVGGRRSGLAGRPLADGVGAVLRGPLPPG